MNMKKIARCKFQPDELVTVLNLDGDPIWDDRLAGPSADGTAWYIVGIPGIGAIPKAHIVPRFCWKKEK
jgi:hypothetical protein